MDWRRVVVVPAAALACAGLLGADGAATDGAGRRETAGSGAVVEASGAVAAIESRPLRMAGGLTWADADAGATGADPDLGAEPPAGADGEAGTETDAGADPDAARPATGRGSIQRDRVPLGRRVATGPDPVRQRGAPARAIAGTRGLPGLGTSLSGMRAGARYTPPDTDGDVGGGRYVQVVSASLLVYDLSSGTVIAGPLATSSIWSDLPGPCAAEQSDATIRYDQLADRWILTRPTLGKEAPYQLCVAVSATGDPTGAWYRYSFDSPFIADYAKLGVWPDGYYVTADWFDATETFQGARVCALERAAMLEGRAARQQCTSPAFGFHSLLPADLDGMAVPPVGTPLPLLSLGRTTGTLASWSFAVDWDDPTRSRLSLPTELAVPAYDFPCATGGACVPQPGTATLLDTLGDRLMYRLAYRADASGGSLLAVHSVAAGDGTTDGTGIRWYRLRIDAGTTVPRLEDAATFAPDARHRWLPAIAADGAGNVAIGYSIGDATTYPSLAVAGRLATDAPGLLTQGETIVQAGSGSQTTMPSGAALTRWGDYASMTVDPADDCTFYFTSEYLPASGVFGWATRIAWFRLPGCLPADGSDRSAGTIDGGLIAPWSDGTTAASDGTATAGSSDGTAPTGGVAGVVSCADPCAEVGGLPAVTALRPAIARVGQTIVLRGRGLAAATSVWIAGRRSPRVVVLGPDRLLAAVPAGARSGRVVVRVAGRSISAPGRLVVRAGSVAPVAWSAAPGSVVPAARVVVRGANLVGVTSVRFGGVAAWFRVLAADRLVAVVPWSARSGRLELRGVGGRTFGRWISIVR